MTAPSSRRGFLSGLASLPLIGGGVALIGAPSAVAQPVTPGMLATYAAWLHYERRTLMHSCFGIRSGLGEFVPCVNPGSMFHDEDWSRPDVSAWKAQGRAALVLAAVGCPLTSAEAEEQWRGTFHVVGEARAVR